MMTKIHKTKTGEQGIATAHLPSPKLCPKFKSDA